MLSHALDAAICRERDVVSSTIVMDLTYSACASLGETVPPPTLSPPQLPPHTLLTLALALRWRCIRCCSALSPSRHQRIQHDIVGGGRRAARSACGGARGLPPALPPSSRPHHHHISGDRSRVPHAPLVETERPAKTCSGLFLPAESQAGYRAACASSVCIVYSRAR